MSSAAIFAVTICGLAALLEGGLAGGGVRTHFATLRLPRYSPPLWAWVLIGALYYVACFIVLYRLFVLESRTLLWGVAMSLALLMLVINAVWNLLFFRLKSLRASVLALVPYSLVVLGLALSLIPLDPLAAWVLVPYIVYLVYANTWVYSLWRANDSAKKPKAR
ncbi:MAG TPA: tryptophan-rich sensory protein [Thermoanaerobaculia bacterium]|nr:tryptophan-rich sensory protein [Thermoanaerobaculia bacterium]